MKDIIKNNICVSRYDDKRQAFLSHEEIKKISSALRMWNILASQNCFAIFRMPKTFSFLACQKLGVSKHDGKQEGSQDELVIHLGNFDLRLIK